MSQSVLKVRLMLYGICRALNPSGFILLNVLLKGKRVNIPVSGHGENAVALVAAVVARQRKRTRRSRVKPEPEFSFLV